MNLMKTWSMSVMVLGFMCAGSLLIHAEVLKVNYLEGTVEKQQGTTWTAVAIAESLDDLTTVRLANDGLLVLDRSVSILTISKAGVYKLSDISKAQGQAAARNLGNLIGRKMTAVTSSGNKATAAAGGVRAADAMERSSRVEWSDSITPSQRIETARRALSVRDIKTVRRTWDAAFFEALPSERDSLVFLIGNDSLIAGYPALAVSYFGRHEALESSPAYVDYALVKARLLFETLDFDTCDRWCQKALATVGDQAARQTLLIVRGLTLRELGNKEGAVLLFTEARAIDGESDAGRFAAKLEKE